MHDLDEMQKDEILKLVEYNDHFAEGFFFDLAYNNKSYLRDYYENYNKKTGKRVKRKFTDVAGNTSEEIVE